MPEVHNSVALVKEVTVNEDKSGVDLKIELQPDGKMASARLGWAYCGNGFGFFHLPKVDDEVLVTFPGGDSSQGIVTARLSNRIDQVPDGISPEKIILVVEDGVEVEISAAKVTLDCPDINLGSGSFEKLVKESFKSTFDAHVHSGGGSGPPTSAMPAGDLTTDLKGT